MPVDYETLALANPIPKWTHTPAQVVADAKAVAAAWTATNDQVAGIKEPTVANVLVPFTQQENTNMLKIGQLVFYLSVSANKELRDASTEAEQILDDNSIEQLARSDVYQVFKKLAAKVASGTEKIDGETQRWLDQRLRSYRRNGLDLPEDKREQVKALQKELSVLSVTFLRNSNEENGHVLFTEAELDGVPEDVILQFEKVTEDGVPKLKMTFKYPDLLPVMKHANVQETRKRAFVGDQNKLPQNVDILKKMIVIRFDISQLLGYKTFADYVLEERLAKTLATVLSFLDDLREKLTPVGVKEIERMKAFKNSDLKARGLPQQDTYYIWDTRYYDNLLLEKEYQVDNQLISEYFPLDLTIDKMLAFYEHLFDLKFVLIQKPKEDTVWHPETRVLAVYKNIKHGEPKQEFLGWLLFDLHPREGKYGHAANFGIGPGYQRADGSYEPVFTVLVCNFTKPSADKPSLLKHDEVTTFFHELGHGVHNIVSQTKYASLHGTNVARDFVETPSQMLEYWTWSKNELKSLSSHYKTGKPIEDALIDLLVKSKHVNTGIFNLRQLFFATYDMKVHSTTTRKETDALELTPLWNDLRQEISLANNGGTVTLGHGSFGHIAGGYEAGYYGYLYSKVFADDIYYTFFKNDPLNVENGLRYRDTVLKPGDSREILDSLKELLGREPNSNAFLQELLG